MFFLTPLRRLALKAGDVARAVARFNTVLVLAACYITVIFPFGLLARLFGWSRFGREKGWVLRGEPTSMERQF